MAKRIRNYKREYKDRISRGRARGLSVSQARGHARSGEIRRKTLTIADPSDPRERALALMKTGKTQKAAAKSAGVSVKRLRRYVKENTTVKRKGRKLIIIDRRPVMMLILSSEKQNPYWIAARRKAASEIGHFWNTINKFLETNKVSHLKPLKGRGVYDVNRKFHPWETRPNFLRKLDSIGELSFVDIYRNTTN